MPIKVIDQLPAVEALSAENVFVMTESRALRQDIRPLPHCHFEFNAKQSHH